MSERDYRRRNSAKSRKLRPPQPSQSPSPSHHRQTPPPARRRSSKPCRPIEIMHRSSSEPSLWAAGIAVIGDDHRYLSTPDGVLYRPQTCTDVFSSPDWLLPGSPQKLENYNRDAKVVVNVTVEGSPGPIKIMIKLGSTVDEAIKLVIKKYGEEGRSPLLDEDAASTFELHQSYFSLDCLDRSNVIGDVGGRSFYLRKGSRRDSTTSSGGESSSVPRPPPSPSPAPFPLFLFPGFIARRIGKIIRRTHKLWRFLGCMQCDG